MEATCSSETSVHTIYTRRHIPEVGILYSHRCENLKSYIMNFIIYSGHFVLLGRCRTLSWNGYAGRGREKKLHLQKFGEENS
jgi:hypothetical protein